ncbi:hypothetical protein SDC9_126276 [bioreactor metagenome]|uniref:Uncharacterized protein n=1 Tax=bioreactor metagenome TaxID=1076179 RepID=A0A645CQP2_9ZZZZ
MLFLYGEPCLGFDTDGQCAGDKGDEQHDEKRNRIPRLQRSKGIQRFDKEKIEQQDAQYRRNHAIEIALCCARDDQHAQNIHHDDVLIAKI